MSILLAMRGAISSQEEAAAGGVLHSIWEGVAPPPSPGEIAYFNDGQPITQGTRFYVTEDGLVATAIRFYMAHDTPRTLGVDNTPTGRTLVGIYDVAPGGSARTLLANGSRDPVLLVPPGDLWVDVPLDTPLPLTKNFDYITGAYSPTGVYLAVIGNNYFTQDYGTTVVAPANEEPFRANALYAYGVHSEAPTLRPPTDYFKAGCYFIDVVVEGAAT